MNQKKATLITIIVALFFGVFFVYPVVEIVKVGFQDASGAFTLDYMLNLFTNPNYREGIWNAFCMGISSTLVTFLIALPLAMASYRWVFPGKKWLSILILAPLVLPPFIGAVGVKHILGVEGSLNSLLTNLGLMSSTNPTDWLGQWKFWGVVMMNALHLYPILFINILASLNKLDPAMEQAAQNLGASPWQRFRKITLPLCMPGVFAGASVVFIWSFTELGVPLVFDYQRVASVQIYNGLSDLSTNPTPYGLVAVMLIISAAVFLFSKLIFGKEDVVSTPRTKARYAENTLTDYRGYLVSVAFALVFLIAAIPHLGVLFLSVSGDWYSTIFPSDITSQHFGDALGHNLVISSIKNSLVYSLGATLVAIVLGVSIAWVIVRSKIWGRCVIDTLMMLPLAIPGFVLAFGYRALSDSDGPFSWLLDIAGGGPILLLIIAYAIRRLPYVVRTAVAGLQLSEPVLEDAAKSLGASPRRTLYRIGLPLVGASVVAGAILAFAFSMIEVSDSLILAKQAEHYPVTKAIYALLDTLKNGYEIAAALGVWAMVFLAVAIGSTFVFIGKKGSGFFKL